MSAHPIIADLRKIRREGRISQEAMAAAIRMASGQTFISRLETGRHDPLLATVSDWADALGYKVALRKKPKAAAPQKRRAVYMNRKNLVLQDGEWRVANTVEP